MTAPPRADLLLEPGFRAMQFKLVVSTNTAGIRCWQRTGFQVLGILPGRWGSLRIAALTGVWVVREQVLQQATAG